MEIISELTSNSDSVIFWFICLVCGFYHQNRTENSLFSYCYHLIWKWQPTPVFLPGESHGQRSLVGYSPWDHKESDTTERLHFHFHFHHLISSLLNKSNGLWICPFTYLRVWLDLKKCTSEHLILTAWYSFLLLDKRSIILGRSMSPDSLCYCQCEL